MRKFTSQFCFLVALTFIFIDINLDGKGRELECEQQKLNIFNVENYWKERMFPIDENNTTIFLGSNNDLISLDLIGGKAANLQKLALIPSVSVPQWFVVSSKLFENYLRDNDISDLVKLLDYLCLNYTKNSTKIADLSDTIKQKIHIGFLDADICEQVNTACKTLIKKMENTNCSFAVRSSGVIEDDLTSSCAGLYDTFLNCQNIEEVIDAIKKVWASSFNMRVIEERVRLKIKQIDCLMGVIVQEQIDAKVAGVISTMVLGNNYPGIQISANYGLGESVVSGEVTVDSWVIHSTQGYILEQIIGSKEVCHLLNSKGGTKEVNVSVNDRNKAALKGHEIYELAKKATLIKKYYGCEVDLEFAIDQKNKIFLLQARPLVLMNSEKIIIVDPQYIDKYKKIASGLYSVPGVKQGRILFVNSLDDLSNGKICPTQDDIVLAYVTTNVWSQYLTHVQGLITREGGPSSHPILLAREKNIPCVIGIQNAFEDLIDYNRKVVTIDGFNQVIYEGSVPTREARKEDFFQQFESITVREWPNIKNSLIHLLHNKMVVEEEGKYWRRTPLYPVAGFQKEINMRRFEVVPSLVGKQGQIEIMAKVIDGYTCTELAPFEEYVALFDGFSLDDMECFNVTYQNCMNEFLKLAKEFNFDSEHWKNYINAYIRFRAYVWLGGAYRAFSERKVDLIGINIELPLHYLEAASRALQSEIPEMDIEMHQTVHKIALQVATIDFPETIDELQTLFPEVYKKIEDISSQFRFENILSLDRPIDLTIVYEKIKQEAQAIWEGSIFATDKEIDEKRIFFPEFPELKAWLRLSIWNRILQSDSHHIEAKARYLVRPKLIQFGQILVQEAILEDPEEIFLLSIDQVAKYMRLFPTSKF